MESLDFERAVLRLRIWPVPAGAFANAARDEFGFVRLGYCGYHGQ